MVKRPIHIRLSMESLNQEKLLASFQNMQTVYMESVIMENKLSDDALCQVIDTAKKKLEARRAGRGGQYAEHKDDDSPLCQKK